MSNFKIYYNQMDTHEIVGIRVVDNDFYVNLPKMLPKKKENVRLMIDVLEKFIRKNKDQKSIVKTNIEDGKNEGNLLIGSMFYLLDDFLDNGYYNPRGFSYVVDQGNNIDFKKTVQKFTPEIYHDELYFKNHIMKLKKVNESDQLRNIHMYAVYKCHNILYFYYGDLDVVSIDDIGLSVEEVIYYLEEQKNLTYNDNKINLIENLISFYKGINNKNEIAYFLETSYFDKVWEEMLCTLVSNTPRENFYFKSKWIIDKEKGYKPKFNKESKLDFIRLLIDKQKKHIHVMVMDAKYYFYDWETNLGRLPGTTDINKQIGYMYFAKKKIENIFKEYTKTYHNSFLLPYNEKIEGSITGVFGIATTEMDESEEILGVYVDIEMVMKQYVSPNKLSLLLSELDDCILEKKSFKGRVMVEC